MSIESVSFSADGRLLAIADASKLRLWDLKKNQWFDNSFQGDISCNNNVQGVVFSPDSQFIATGSTGSIGDSGSYICLRNLSGHQLAKFKVDGLGGWHGLSFSPDSKLLFTTEYNSDNIAQAWRIKSFHELIIYGCNLVGDYLSVPGSDVNESDRKLCEGVGNVDQKDKKVY